MIIRALRNFRFKDTPRGRIAIAHVGDEIPFDNVLDNEQINSIILDLRGTVISDEVLENGEYRVCCHFNRAINGEIYASSGKSTIYLPRAVAVELMARGFVRPLDEGAWYPGKPLQAVDFLTTNAKRMFDAPQEKPKESWLWGYRK